MKKWITYLFLILFSFACKKEEVGPQCPTCEEEIAPSTTDVLIGCEGNFGWGNASLAVYNPTSKTVVQQVFQNVNGFTMGDVLQSFHQYGNNLYIIMNNSGKIEVIDTSDYSYKATINGLTSPRFMVSSDGLGYVSDLYSDRVSVIDLNTNMLADTIGIGRWSEHLLIENNLLYIACPDTNWVLQYNLLSEQFTDTIIVGKSPSGIQQTSDGHIWIINSGGYLEEIPKLIEYDGNSILQTLSFPSINDSPSQLSFDAKTNQLIYLNDGVYSFDPNSTALPQIPIIDANNAIFYGLGIDPNNSDIYVTDAIDYVQPGRVFRFDSLFNPIDTFSTGIIPQGIWFK